MDGDSVPEHEHPMMHHRRRHMARANAPGGFAYFLGFLASLIYYIQTATSFGVGLLGVLKAFFWPAFLVYSVLRYVHA